MPYESVKENHNDPYCQNVGRNLDQAVRKVKKSGENINDIMKDQFE